MNNIRSTIFFLLDKFKKNNVKNHYDEVSSFSDKVNKHSLNSLLQHATSTTKYYKSFLKKHLEDFPIVNKGVIKNNVDSFISTKYNKSELLKATTSGSTGTPFSVYLDANKKARNTADTLVFGEKAGYNIGEKLYYVKIWSAANYKNKLTKFLQNIETVDVLLMDDSKLVNLIAKWEKHKNPFGFIGYASALENIYKYLITNGISKLNTNINSIITISETLDPIVKEGVSKIFETQVLSRYSNVENGIIAQQTPDGNDWFEINSASYFIEILDESSDTVLNNGETGRIVLTDLYNYGMPLIRYDTGDIGSVVESKGKLYFNNLSGRKLDSIFNTNGDQVNSLLVYKNMWQYTELDQYQLIQKSPKDYEIVVSGKQKFSRKSQIINEFKEYLGKDAEIFVTQVDEIPLLASGKRRKVVQEYYK